MMIDENDFIRYGFNKKKRKRNEFETDEELHEIPFNDDFEEEKKKLNEEYVLKKIKENEEKEKEGKKIVKKKEVKEKKEFLDKLMEEEINMDLISEKKYLIKNILKDKKNFNDLEFEVKENLDAILNLFEYRKIKFVVEALEIYKMNCLNEDLISSKFIFENIKLNDVKNILEKIKMIFGLESFQIQYFEKVKKAKDYVFGFIKNIIDFDKTIGILNNNNGTYQINILTDLMKSKRFLEPFSNSDTKFSDIIDFVKTNINNEQDLKNLNCFDTVFENLETIKIWISQIGGLSIDNINNSIHNLFDTAYYVSYGSVLLNTNNLLIEYTSKTNQIVVVPNDQLVDLVRKAIFCSNEFKNSQVSMFLESYNIANEIHNIIQELEENGHPEFQSEKKKLGNNITPQFLNSLKLELENKLKNWKECFESIIQNNNELLLLSSSQLIQYMFAIKMIDNESHSNYKKIISYSYICLYDQLSGNRSAITLEDIKKIKNKFMKEKTNNDLFNVILFLKYLKELYENEIIDENMVDIEENETMFIKIQKYHVDNINFIISKLTDLSRFQTNSPLFLTSQILFCTDKTTTKELLWFEKRRKIFLNFIYIIYGVDLLHPNVRKVLIELETQKNVKRGKTYLLFNSNIGLDNFIFLKEEKLSIEDMIPAKEISKYNKIKIIKVKGMYLTGKSLWIENYSKNNQFEYMKIGVNEDFSTLNFLKRISKLDPSKFKKLLFHFNITSKQALDKFEYFLFNYIFCGLWIDDSGCIEIPPTDIQIEIIVEIPDGDFDKNTNEIEYLNQYIPTLELLGQEIDIFRDHPFILTKDVKLVCLYYKNFINNSLNNIVSTSFDRYELKDEECFVIIQSIFDQHKKITNTKFHQNMFFTLLRKKLEFLRLQINKGINFARNDLFKIMINECEQISNIGYKLSTFKGPYSILDFTNISPQIIDLNENPQKFEISSNKKQKLIESNGILRNLLANGLNVPSNRITNILKQENYVVTIDFAMKMFILNERLKISSNVIIIGKTGVGKTELIEALALLLNHSTKVIPSKSELIEEFFKKYYQNTEIYNEDLIKKLNEFKQNNQFWIISELITKIMVRYIETDDFDKLTSFTINFLEFFDYKLYYTYPLIEKSNIFQNYCYKSKSKGFKIDSINTIIMLFKEIYNSRSNIIYKKIMMHGGLKIENLREMLKKIISSHNKYKSGFNDLKTIIFIDELNTSSYLGYLKEIIVDRTLDGEKIPNSIFFIGNCII
jgi:energy-coupling factor transporter ATP-binding protein EcfA2